MLLEDGEARRRQNKRKLVDARSFKRDLVVASIQGQASRPKPCGGYYAGSRRHYGGNSEGFIHIHKNLIL